MIEDKKLLKRFRKQSGHHWPCPSCNLGFLKVDKTTFNREETAGSVRAHNHEAWDPDWIEYVFTCLLICTNPNCNEPVVCSGSGVLEIEEYFGPEGPTRDYVDYFQPKFFYPPLQIFDCPTGTPEGVRLELEASFSMFFSNPSSAANRARIAVECLLTALKIKRFENGKNRRRRTLSLDARIKLLGAKHEHIKEMLLAVKWLGNVGSHQGKQLTAEDVIDAYKILEEVLDELYVRSKRTGRKLAAEIVKRKGPIKRKSPRKR